MNQKLFIKSAGLLLLLTSLAKLFTVFEGVRILQLHDPILGVRFRYVFLFIGIIEMGLAYACLFFSSTKLRLLFIAWLSSCFVVYRAGLWSIGIHACPCLGNFADALHLSNLSANIITLSVLAYLLFGSYFFILKDGCKSG
jgi:predicted secreted protein